jgi:outer membrane protein, heavy metal efflux system
VISRIFAAQKINIHQKMISRFNIYIFNILLLTVGCIQWSYAIQPNLEPEQIHAFRNPDIISDTLYLTLTQAEQLFLENNLMLLAQRFEIQKAEALTRQARLWNNPELSISEVNFNNIPASELFDDIGDKPRQFSIEIEQIITTAGKRSRLVRMHQILAEKQEHIFDDLLRALKYELRSAFYSLNLLIHTENLLTQEASAIEVIIDVMGQQQERGNISRAELLRLQTLLFGIRKEKLETITERIRLQKKLTMLLHIESGSMIIPSGIDLLEARQQIVIAPLSELLDKANNERPDLIASRAEARYYQADISYQRSKAIPDISLGAMYDRWGGISKNYIGFGMSVDLPLFDRNQGHIRASSLAFDQQSMINQSLESEVKNQVLAAWKTLLAYENLLDQTDMGYIEQQEEIFQQIIRNYENRNIGLLEFLDFFQSYRESKLQYMTIRNNAAIAAEELNHAVGTDVVNYN